MAIFTYIYPLSGGVCNTKSAKIRIQNPVKRGVVFSSTSIMYEKRKSALKEPSCGRLVFRELYTESVHHGYMRGYTVAVIIPSSIDANIPFYCYFATVINYSGPHTPSH